jgi:4-amino-4-deoxy-L-arabinose transferase-like glycosyltransferase
MATDQQIEQQTDRRASHGQKGTGLLVLSLACGLFTHGFNMFKYPLFITDEGIYVQQAWSVVKQGKLSPYTYFYDHAPAGWMVMAGWATVMPRGFQTFGNEIATVRVLMLVTHVVATGLLFGIVRRWSGSPVGAFIAAFVFNFSPLAIYYQRQVLLDNLMVLWLLLAVYLITRSDGRVMTFMMAGLFFGLAVITKENAIFFAPAVGYLVHRCAREWRNRRFVTSFWWFAVVVPVSVYLLFAQLKNELLPSDLSFDLNNPPADHVSLLYTVWWQINRSGPEGRSIFLELMRTSWLFKDRYTLIIGGISVLVVLFLWSRDRKGRAGYLAAALMALGYGFYLARGSVLLDFYVTPMLALLAINVGLLYGHVMKAVSKPMMVASTAFVVAVALALPGGYLLHRDTEGKLQAQDLYHLQLTPMQDKQIAYVRANIPTDARIIIDDDIWTALHDRKPYYPRAHSHFKAASDPDIRDRLFKSDWQNIDYVVMSNKMRLAMERNNSGSREQWMLDAIDNHGEVIWKLDRGDIHLAIVQIKK